MKQLLFAFLLFSIESRAQITVKEQPKLDTNAARVPINYIGTTQFYFGAGKNNAFRVLKSNDAPFGKPLGYRTEEEHVKIWAYEAGVKRIVNKHFIIDGALSIERYGESYASSQPFADHGDSSYSYINHYSYVSLPIQGYIYTGNDFKFMLGGGLQPGIVGKFVKTTTIKDSLGTATTTEVNKPEQLSSFILNARVSGGVQWQWSKAFAIYFLYTYQVGLTSTYSAQQPYKHYIRAGGLRFGLSFTIPE